VIGAPILSVDTQERTVVPDPSTKSSTDVWASGAPRHLLPENVRIGSEVAVEVRAKGIYSVPVYVSKIVITGEFDPHAITDIARSHAAASERWSVTAGTGRASAKPLSRPLLTTNSRNTPTTSIAQRPSGVV
jgi:inner membrane protein involved in colicin E2 resistance